MLGPLPDLYNAPKNEYGYMMTNFNVQAVEIWSLESDWESFISEVSPKQPVMGLVVRRLSGSKEIVNMLHKCNRAISYHDIRTQNLAWSRE